MSVSHSELLHFDWRALSVLGSSTFSLAGRSNETASGGIPVVQLKMDLAAKRFTPSVSAAAAADISEETLITCPVPIAMDDGARLVHPTHSLVCELDAATLDATIRSLQAAISKAS